MQASEQWEKKRKNAEDEHTLRRSQRRLRKRVHEQQVSCRATHEHDASQQRAEARVDAIQDMIGTVSSRKAEHSHSAASRTHALEEGSARHVQTRRRDCFNDSCDVVSSLGNTLGCFPQRKPEATLGGTVSPTFTPRPPGSPSCLAASGSSPGATGGTTAGAGGGGGHGAPVLRSASPLDAPVPAVTNGRGCITKAAIRAAQEWLSYAKVASPR